MAMAQEFKLMYDCVHVCYAILCLSQSLQVGTDIFYLHGSLTGHCAEPDFLISDILPVPVLYISTRYGIFR